MCKILTIYQVPISVLTQLKLKIKVSKMTKKQEALDLNRVEPIVVKSLACPVSLC